MKRVVTLYCINERTEEIIPYIVKDDFSTEFPKDVFLSYRDNFVAGFSTPQDAKAWVKKRPRPPTYAEAAKLKQDEALRAG